MRSISGFYLQESTDYSSWPLQVGEIRDVNADKHVCTVAIGGMVVPNVNWSTPAFSCGNGAGFYTMPEPGSRVIIGKFYDNQWYIFGFIPYNSRQENYDSVNGRKSIQYGDVVMGTASGNFIEIRRYGESLQIRNNANCYIALEGTGNKITIRNQNFYFTSDSCTAAMQSNDLGQTTTSLYFKRKVDDSANFVKLDIGTTGLKNSSVYENSGNDSTEVIFSLNFGSKARITVDIEGNIKMYGKSLRFMAEESVITESNGIIEDRAVLDIEHRKIAKRDMNKPSMT